MRQHDKGREGKADDVGLEARWRRVTGSGAARVTWRRRQRREREWRR